MYRRKLNGRVKARIVPHGSKDSLKNSLTNDAPCTRPELLRLLCSRAAAELTEISELDIFTAFLQAEGFEREVYVTLAGEEKDAEHV